MVKTEPIDSKIGTRAGQRPLRVCRWEPLALSLTGNCASSTGDPFPQVTVSLEAGTWMYLKLRS